MDLRLLTTMEALAESVKQYLFPPSALQTRLEGYRARLCGGVLARGNEGVQNLSPVVSTHKFCESGVDF